MRLVALGLAAALCLGMSPVSALAEGEGDPSGDDSSSEFVGSDSFENLFGFAVAKDQKAYTYQNFLALANPRKNDPMTYGSYNTDGNLYSDSQAYSKANISLLADWEFVSDFTIISSNVCNHAFAGFSVGGNSVRIGTSRGKNEISHFDGGADATVLQRTPLDLDKDIKGTQDVYKRQAQTQNQQSPPQLEEGRSSAPNRTSAAPPPKWGGAALAILPPI